MHLVGSILASAFIFLAQAAPPEDPGPRPVPDAGAASGPDGGFMSSFLIVGILFAFMYLFLFRPQRQKEQEEKSMLEKIKKNDHVVTRGGIIGVVMNVKDDEVVLKVDERQDVKIRFQKNAISGILSGGGGGAEKKDDDEKDKKG